MSKRAANNEALLFTPQQTSQVTPPAGIIVPLSPSITQVKFKDSHRAKLMRYAIESVGSRVIGEVVRHRDKAFITCHADPALEDLLKKQIMACGILHNVKLIRFSHQKLLIQFPDNLRAPRKKMNKERVSTVGSRVRKIRKELELVKEYMRTKKFVDKRDAAGREECATLLRLQFQELKSKHKNFQIFDAIKKQTELKTKLMEQLPHSRQFILIAKEFTAVLLGETLPTVNEAWYQFRML
jgi:hypothetical protein